MKVAYRFFKRLLVGLLASVALLLTFALPAVAADKADVWVYITNDHVEDLRSILAQGLDPNIKNPKGDMPAIMLAVKESSWKCFDLLLNQPKIDLNVHNGFNETPIMYVAFVGDLARTKKMLDKGAEVNNLGCTALHYAAMKGYPDIVNLLLSKGALPNAPAPDGSSPLMMGVKGNNFKVVQALINAGAEPTARNLAGEDAIDFANKFGHVDWAKQMTKIAADRKAKAIAKAKNEPPEAEPEPEAASDPAAESVAGVVAGSTTPH